MKTISVWDKNVVLDIPEDGELRVKHLRKISPILNEGKMDMEGLIKIVCALSENPVETEKTLDDLTPSQFNELSEAFGEILNVEKKTTESSNPTPKT